MAYIKAKLDLYSDEDGKLVSAGDDARVLVARVGDEVPPGYVDQVTSGGNLKSKKPVADKAAPQAENKAKAPSRAKPKKRGGKK